MSARAALATRVGLLAFFGLSLLATPFFWGEFQNPYLFIPVAAEAAVGWVITGRRQSNPMGWVFLGIGASCGLLVAAIAMTSAGAAAPGPTPWWALLGSWASDVGWMVVIYLLTVLTVLMYPDGLASPRWRPVLRTSVVALVVGVVVTAFQPDLTLTVDAQGNSLTAAPNPLAERFPRLASFLDTSPLFEIAGLTLLGCGLLGVVSMVLRARRADGTEKEQLRWFAFAVVLVAVEIVSEPLVNGQVPDWWTNAAEVLVLSFVPVACGVAILRYRLYDIDRIISRTTAYAIVTGLLLGAYALIVVSVNRLLPQANQLTVAAATLAAAALARPLLRRVQSMVDRRFNRASYDAQRSLDAFGSRLTHEIDMGAVSEDLQRTVEATLQPSVVTLWLSGRP